MTRADGAEPGEIARRLTGAEARGVRWLPADGSVLPRHAWRSGGISLRLVDSLRKRGLALAHWRSTEAGGETLAASLTPLGRAVRAAIAQQEAAADGR